MDYARVHVLEAKKLRPCHTMWMVSMLVPGVTTDQKIFWYVHSLSSSTVFAVPDDVKDNDVWCSL